MQWTPEQREKIRKAKEAGKKSVMLEFNAAQKNEWADAKRQELNGKDENIAHLEKVKAAAEQAGFFGDVRRAITHSRQPIDKLANDIGIEVRLLSDFRAGDAQLPASSLERLIDLLGLQLMQQIPR